jgi:hypothetical protein
MPEPMTVAAFYADDRRRRSREVSFGLEWTVTSDPHAIYGVHWIEETQEIYVLRGPEPPLDASAPFIPSSSPLIIFESDAYEVIVLGQAENEAVLRRALDGWEAHMTGPNSLQWVRERLYDAAGRTTINLP